jgi:hypothetical protein
MSASESTGRRNDVQLHRMEPGDYGQAAYGDQREWVCRAPNGYGGALRLHTVTEHDDRTITVEPSILIERPGAGRYHFAVVLGVRAGSRDTAGIGETRRRAAGVYLLEEGAW